MPFVELNELEEKGTVPELKAAFIHSDHLTRASMTIEEYPIMLEHSHPCEEVSSVVNGKFELTIGEETRALNPGSVADIPPNSAHSGKALSKCRIIDTFYPIRKDCK
jgi:quercetin dioxygenase-like cupin family protein